jgi:putative GTP pyrophosphokinase
MIDRETALLTRWTDERPMYEAWGRFIADQMTQGVTAAIAPAEIEEFFKIPISARTKLPSSMLAKAFHRKKPYQNPYEDIEDKVGVRVVVLFADDIGVVERVVESNANWTWTKARDYEEELLLRPYEFDYQSMHYIVRAKAGLRWDTAPIAEGIPCELQIRTLLQHAYSELTHDTIYKPSVAADPSVKRAAAKSMALIEATGDYFTQVKAKLALAAAPGELVAETLVRMYADIVGRPAEKSAVNSLIIDHYKSWAKEDFGESLAALYSAKPFLADRITERAPSQALYRQPGVLLVYWVIDQAPILAAKDSPLTEAELSVMYSDLGRTIPT